MLLTRLYLRNFRVYEDELDLALPPNLVGIYGANGAGKSTLLEAITFTLWGKARTGRDEVRTAGVGADAVTEVEFDHEGHLYVVRRTLSGINATMRAEAHCDGLAMAEGVTDTRRYVQSVLGMDDVAFKASVFAEQKQLASFSSNTPAERRKLVLALLGITPLDGARDAARRDAREAEGELKRLRGLLPDLAALEVEAADADAAAAAAEAVASTEAEVAAAAGARAEDATRAWAVLDRRRQDHDRLDAEARHAAQDLATRVERRAGLEAELAELAEVSDEERRLAATPDDVVAGRAVLEALRALALADRRLEAAAPGDEPPVPDPTTSARLTAEAAEASARRAQAVGLVSAATDELARAEAAVARSGSLSPIEPCPLCGQALGAAFEQVSAHRDAERRAAATRLESCRTELDALDAAATRASGAATAETRRLQAVTEVRQAWEATAARRAEAVAARADASLAVGRAGGPDPEELTDPAAVVAIGVAWRDRLAEGETRQSRLLALRTRLERRPALQAALAEARDGASLAAAALDRARAAVADLAFEPDALATADQARLLADEVALAARAGAGTADREALKRRVEATGQARRRDDGRAQHAALAELDVRSRHLARLAVLLAEFRNTVVATVGPRLAAQAADLFAELTDREYDRLEVDPETYELQISDAGRTYGLDRFSGSEVDLANLALRVAISEHVRFQSGGTVGLLVLDEVFGPLDEDRKARMLTALEQLRGRFRQILVVTHDTAIKEQLPNAIEVVKRPGRRATARVIGD